MSTQKKNYTLPIIVMFALFFMIAFVTNFAGSMGVIVKNQFNASDAMSQLGTLANFIAYACMGIPAGLILKRKGYKFTSLAAVTVGFIGVGIQFLSGYVESFEVYVLGAFVAGFSMCMLNIVVNPMLNTLGGGGNKGNRLLQLGGSCNSIGGTLAPILLGYLIGGEVETASVGDAAPAMIIAMSIFALAFVIISMTKIPEPHMESAEEKAARKSGNKVKDKYGPMSFRHFVLGAVAIFFYVGIEVGIPNIANLYMTTPTIERAESIIERYEAQQALIAESATTTDAPATETTDGATPTTDAPAQPAEPAPADTKAVVEKQESVAQTDTNAVNADQSSVADAQNSENKAENGAEPAANADDAKKPTVKKEKEITKDEYDTAQAVVKGDKPAGLAIPADVAGLLVGIYWFLMMCGRLLGGIVGGRVSSKAMLTFVSLLAMSLVAAFIFIPSTCTITVPTIESAVPLGVAVLFLCGLCTSVMWGGIFNLAAEGLGKYTAAASGIFMALVCGGGIIPFVQGWLVDYVGYLSSYWLIFACLGYLLFYALIGSKVVNKDIKVD